MTNFKDSGINRSESEKTHVENHQQAMTSSITAVIIKQVPGYLQ